MSSSLSSRIQSATLQTLKAPLCVPFRTALGQHDFLENVLLAIELENGILGYGEAAIATHITGETVEQTKKNLSEIALKIVGRSVVQYETIANLAREIADWNGAARAAVEMAVLDALSKQRKIPFWKLFGERFRPVQTDMTVVIDSVKNSAKSAREICAQGIQTLKIKVGRDEELDFERVQKVCQIARNRKILIDGNQGYTATQMIRFVRRLKQSGIVPDLIEQPVAKEDWDGLRQVTRETKLIVAADESVRSISDARKLIKGNYANAINIKFMKCGILESREIARLAKSKGLKLMIGQMMESELATTAAAHFAGGLGGFEFVDLDAPFFMKQKAMTRFCAKRNGIYDLSSVKIGIGTEPI